MFPCQPGRKAPATAHGYLDATTDPGQITAWFSRHPDRNLAVATGQPGPDVLDIDKRPDGNGFPALSQLSPRRAGSAAPRRGCGPPAAACTPTSPASRQRSGHLPARHLDFRSAGGYVLVPPSRSAAGPTGSSPPRPAMPRWTGSRPPRSSSPAAGNTAPSARPGHRTRTSIRLAAWVARLEEGNRNSGLFWAACRAIEAGRGADLGRPGRGCQAGRARRPGDPRHPRLRPAHHPPAPPTARPAGKAKASDMTSARNQSTPPPRREH